MTIRVVSRVSLAGNVMGGILETLAWDSEFFGIPIGRIVSCRLDKENVQAVLEEARSRGLRCIYFQGDPDDPVTVETAEQQGFHLVDVRVVMEHPYDNRPAPIPRYAIRQGLLIDVPRQEELERLQDIAAQIGHTSRFDFDKNFESGDCERLYRRWIKSACEGFADIVLVARWACDSMAVGLIACAVRDGTCHIQLAGVQSGHRQQGVGTGLVQSALDWGRIQNAHSMQVVTQARNVSAQRLYQQMGFFTKSMTLYYHKWL